MRQLKIRMAMSAVLNALPLMLATYLPDLPGDYLRYSYYKRKLKSLGSGSRIDLGVIIEAPQNVCIGDYAYIDKNVIIAGGRGVKIGRRVHIAHNCLIQGGGFVEIGDYVGIAAGSMIFSATDTVYGGKHIGPMVPSKHKNPLFEKPVILKKDAFLGCGCIVLPGVTIGEGAVVGAGSLVLNDIPPWKVAVGSPAKPIKDRPKITAPDI